MSQTFYEAAGELESRGQSFVVVTLISGRGHIPQDPGAKAIVTANGLYFGTVGGGKVEARAIREAQALLQSEAREAKDPVVHTWNLQKDIGMTCGGEITYLFEIHRPHSWRVRIFGAGHVAQALVRVLANLPVSVTCVDPRGDWVRALPQDQSNLEAIHQENPSAWISEQTLSRDDFFVVITQGHATDVPVLESIFKKMPIP
ncbi:MAG: XdhC family protein, partial [Bdellovibrionales bacterium]|nr:XdhC family protein [Bdellovibrionales bacterium]